MPAARLAELGAATGVTMIRFLLAVLLLALAVPAVQAEARYPAYQVDLQNDACRAKVKRGQGYVLAASAFGAFHCAFGDAPLAELRAVAVARCQLGVPEVFHKAAPCRPVIENGREVGGKVLSALRREMRGPVDIVLDDGQGGTVRRRGVLTSGKMLSANRVAVRLVQDDGTELCTGSFSLATGSYTGTCRDLQFTGRAVPRGNFIQNGQLLGIFDITLRYRKAAVRITTRVPEGARVYR